jgi:hypothetical protein
VVLKVPFGALPTAVRTADTITASFIIYVPCPKSNVQTSLQKRTFDVRRVTCDLIPQRLSRF